MQTTDATDVPTRQPDKAVAVPPRSARSNRASLLGALDFLKSAQAMAADPSSAPEPGGGA
jgi:hypothetical protein